MTETVCGPSRWLGQQANRQLGRNKVKRAETHEESLNILLDKGISIPVIILEFF